MQDKPKVCSIYPVTGEGSGADAAITGLHQEGEMKTQRPVPAPLMEMLREKFPRLLHAVIEGENDLYLVMADKKGRPHHAVHFVADPRFMTAVRVYDSGIENFEMLCGETGFQMSLLAPRGAGSANDGSGR